MLVSEFQKRFSRINLFISVYDIENDRWYEDSDFPISEDGIRDHITKSASKLTMFLYWTYIIQTTYFSVQTIEKISTQISRNGEVLILGGQLYTGAINWVHDSDATNKVWSGKRKSGVWTMEWTLLSKTMLEARLTFSAYSHLKMAK